jgi:hypothetical protein
LTSHGRAKSEKKSAARFRFFTTTATSGEALVEVIGEPYEHLLDNIRTSRALALFARELELATELPAKKGGLNIEGMTARPDGGVWIGLRAPLPGGRAIIIDLQNPLEVVRGQRPKLGPPALLALDGGGVRALSWWRDRYWILASTGDAPTQLYAWTPNQPPKKIEQRAMEGLNPEAFFSPDATRSWCCRTTALGWSMARSARRSKTPHERASAAAGSNRRNAKWSGNSRHPRE